MNLQEQQKDDNTTVQNFKRRYQQTNQQMEKEAGMDEQNRELDKKG